jgi:hypothetical protein
MTYDQYVEGKGTRTLFSKMKFISPALVNTWKIKNESNS